MKLRLHETFFLIRWMLSQWKRSLRGFFVISKFAVLTCEAAKVLNINPKRTGYLTEF